ncbi:hypothetical protein BCR35DRAFT_299370 [Leucosporidium creatinivorum]|uniref:Urease accessory protein UreF n=1 Tax=Leucosporidium creatinivorum TaxID=106004 RepID=A0A1Y2G2W4_9BASI|nr:hypothetical protein BCR35DRAFT_299370 [Leucosporidium creatinivorum]
MEGLAGSGSLEQYLLLLLSDSNLPTGGFIASSGLESYIQHGLLASDGAENKAQGVLHFLRKSLHAYARLSLPFLSSAHLLLLALPATSSDDAGDDLSATQNAFTRLLQLDHQFETMSLNHIARRASTAQGVALLTLYERALAPEVEAEGKGPRQLLVERLRKAVRAGEALGHLPVGFAAMAGACGLTLASTQHLFLFLHARSLLSSAVRLNTLGPYLAHRQLLHDVRPLVEEALASCKDLRVAEEKPVEEGLGRKEWWEVDEGEDEEGPATTWPLGEILAARHDQLHSKIFNS